MLSKRWLLRAFFAVQVCLFFVFYFDRDFKLRGIEPITRATQGLEQEIGRVQRQIDKLNQELDSIQASPDAYYERLARENLGMAKQGDRVYVYEPEGAL